MFDDATDPGVGAFVGVPEPVEACTSGPSEAEADGVKELLGGAAGPPKMEPLRVRFPGVEDSAMLTDSLDNECRASA